MSRPSLHGQLAEPNHLRAARYTELLRALSGIELDEADRRSLWWLANFDTAERIANLIARARSELELGPSLDEPIPYALTERGLRATEAAVRNDNGEGP